MAKPILFKGTEYASIESMPADVRAAYEADQQQLAELLPDVGQDAPGNDEPLAAAWGGGRLVVGVGGRGVEGLPACIEKRVYERLGPPLADAYQAGQPLTFGPVTVARASGLTIGGTTYAWTDIRNIQVEYGRLTVTLRD